MTYNEIIECLYDLKDAEKVIFKGMRRKQIYQFGVDYFFWEICDSFSMGLFSKSKFALTKILEWTERKPEFEKRAGFAIMASY